MDPAHIKAVIRQLDSFEVEVSGYPYEENKDRYQNALEILCHAILLAAGQIIPPR